MESGGNPENIPELSYEEFLDFHRTYYHPSNSYIYLYGNMDMEEKLRFIDEKYLSAFDALDVDSAIKEQAAFSQVKELQIEYPVSESEEEEDNTYLSLQYGCGKMPLTAHPGVARCAGLCASRRTGAPLKQALLDAGIGKDIYGDYSDGVLQPFFSIVAKGAKTSQKEKFVSVIINCLQDIVRNGIDKKAILAGINYMEFRYRERPISDSSPKG